MNEIKGFSLEAKREKGYQLDRVQRGKDPLDWKPVQEIGSGVREIRARDKDGIYWVIYVAKFEEAVYVLHALESDPVKAENMKLRSALMIAINDHIEAMGLTQAQGAKRLHSTQPRVSALTRGKIEEFRLDTLINMVHRLGLHVTMQITA